MVSIPTAGYPTRKAAVMALKKQRLSHGSIAKALSLSSRLVSAIACDQGWRRPRRWSDLSRTVCVPSEITDALKPHAEKRGIHPNELMRLILAATVEGGIVDAVLDDAEELN